MASGLEVHDLSVRYGKHQALDGVSLRVAPGEIVVILGANGAGKSTLLKAIGGVCEGRVTGSVTMAGEPVSGLPAHRVVERGIALVPEGRGIFGDLTVRENLTLGANPSRARDEEVASLDRLIRLFPKLQDRAGQVARTMSGGEQQMVAIGRAMMSNPVILMLDEPSLGLSPLLSKELFQTLKAVRAAGLGILLVEQNAKLSLGIADRGYLLENGRILREDRAEVLIGDPAVQAAYLGGGGQAVPAPRTAGPAALSLAAAEAPPADLPPGVTIRARPHRSVPASEIVGLDLDAIIAGAAARSRPAAPARPPTVAPGQAQAAKAARSDRLSATLAGIEAAARKSTGRVPLSPLPPLRPMGGRTAPIPHTAPPAQASPDAAPPPQPGGRVEVYRRRPGSDHFDRTEV
jgi:branched-chain amino acid transport system ATP-binding protein